MGMQHMPDAELLTELENLAGLIARGQLTEPRKVGKRIARIGSQLRAALAVQTTIVEKIASFPLEEQNVLKHGHQIIYGFNAWHLTVGDVREARKVVPQPAAPGNEPEDPESDRPAQGQSSNDRQWLEGLKRDILIRVPRRLTAKEFLTDKIDARIADCRTADETNREHRHGTHLLTTAKSLGWKDDGQGALEFMLRRAREVAFEDSGYTPAERDFEPEDSGWDGPGQRSPAETSEVTRLRDAPPELVQRCKEILEWRDTGLLNKGTGGALRAYAEQLTNEGIDEVNALGVAESRTVSEALKELVRVRLAALLPAPAAEDESQEANSESRPPGP
jgi:hypothetical protein